MSVILKSGASSDLATVDSNKNLQVNLPMTPSQSGYSVIMGEAHNGDDGLPRVVRAAKVSADGRLRVGSDSLHWQDRFNHSQVSLGAYQQVTATATIALTGGYLVLNAGNSVASAAVARVQTYRSFPLNAFGSLEVGFRVRFALAAQTNNVVELGIGFATTTTTPTDGVYFKLNSAGALVGVININGTETTTSAMPAFTPNNVSYYRIVVDQDRAEFYIDGVLHGVIDSPLTSPSVAFARAQPLLMRLYNSAATTSAQRVEISDVSVMARDLITNRSIQAQQATMCMSSIEAPRGVVAGQTANYVNSTVPTSATLSNTAAGYATLGGQYQFAAVAGSETDYALFGYQVAAASTIGGNKTLVITGIKIETFNMGAVSAVTPTLLQWGIGVGSTAVSLATVDSATAGTRAPRRMPLGVQSIPVGAAIGSDVKEIDVPFDTPIVVESGTFVHVILRMPVGTATASQIIRGIVAIRGYWE